jgi:hypothetical protein
MKIIRWIICFPSAMALSLVLGLILSELDHSFNYDKSIFGDFIGLWYLWVITVIPSVVFVLSGVLVSPCKKRWICFVFFGLAPFFSGGGLSMMRYHNAGDLYLWTASALGVVVGSILGLFLGFKLQSVSTAKSTDQIIGV